MACYEGNSGAMRKILQRRTLSISRVAVLVLCLARLAPLAIAHAQFKDCQASQGELTLSRNAQNWQFLDALDRTRHCSDAKMVISRPGSIHSSYCAISTLPSILAAI